MVIGYSLLYVAFFSPVLFTDRLLAPGDAIRFYLPHYYAPVGLWTDSMFGGFPLAADQVQAWYPLASLWRLLPESWNAFVITAYVLGSAFAYGYVLTVTGSRFAAAASGAAYGLSGPMLAHLAHTNFIHGALWTPLVVWSLHMLRERFHRGWFAAGTLAVGLAGHGGNPQIFAFGLTLAALYALFLFFTPGPRRVRFAGSAILLVLLGLALGAAQLIPTAELVALGNRVRISFEDFASFALPPGQLPTLIFPFLFGGFSQSWYGVPYFGDWNFHELVGYVGLLPPLLGAAALVARHRLRLTLFWCAAAVLLLLLMLGAATPLAHVVYELPGYNKFRAAGRHSFAFALAVSVLAGLGIDAMARGAVSRRRLAVVLTLAVVAIFAILVKVHAVEDWMAGLAATRVGADVHALPWRNRATALPLAILLVVAAALLAWHRDPGAAWRRCVLAAALLLDLGSFGWFLDWRYAAPPRDYLDPTPAVQHYRDRLARAGQRLLTVHGAHAGDQEIPVNTNRLWDVPSAGGYSPFILKRISELYPMAFWGAVGGSWFSESSRALDITGVRYVVLPEGDLTADRPSPGFGEGWSDVALGPGCGVAKPDQARFRLPRAANASRIELVTSLACSGGVAEGAPVLEVAMHTRDGRVARQTLLAGRHTSEWSYDCPDVQPHMRHRRAPIHESGTVFREGRVLCQGHRYTASLAAPGKELEEITLRWVGGDAAIDVFRVQLVDEATGREVVLNPLLLALSDTMRWLPAESLAPGVRIFENRRALPRVWLVEDVRQVSGPEALAAIQNSRFSDGDAFEPRSTALIEVPTSMSRSSAEALESLVRRSASRADAPGSARLVEDDERSEDETAVVVQVVTRTPSFLVLADSYYPGWEATVDGVPAPIFQTNYVQRGVPVPAGSHTVVFRFRPASVRRGAAVTLASGVCLALVLLGSSLHTGIAGRRGGKRTKP